MLGNLGRGGPAPSPSDLPLLPQCLPLEPITLGVQKYTRSGELRRVLGVPLGSRAAASEDHSYAKPPPPPPPVATEELKHFKESVLDTSKSAKDRVKLFGDSLFKLEKYKESLSSKKRQRSDVSSLGPSMGKLQRNALGAVTPQRMEERTKGVGMLKRVRSFMGDVQIDSRSTGSSRQQMVLEKGGCMVHDAGGGTNLLEEKIHPLPAGGEGWDTKIKKKRSVGAVGSRIINTDRDVKRTMHPNMGSDSKLQSCGGQGFRLKSSTGVGVNKMDGSSELANSDSGALLKNEMESGTLPGQRANFMEQTAMPKGIHKSNIHEDRLTSSANRIIKAKVSRAPRTGSVMLLDSSLKVYPLTAAPLQGSEQSTSLNRVPDPTVAYTHRDHIPLSPSSHSMAQWVGQRPHKNSRARRASIGAPVSNHVEAQIMPQGFPASFDFSTRTSSTGTNGSLITSSIENNTPKSKWELQSPFELSESEESGAGDSKLKCKGADTGEISLNQTEEARSSLLPPRKHKLPTNEIGDSMKRQGRSGRGASLTRSCALPVKKLDNAPTARPLLSSKPSSQKNKSKTGRPPSKKLKDRKAATRVRPMLKGNSIDTAVESNDDHDELFAAANSARSSASLACTGSFWKKMESIFSSVSSEDVSYLKKQLNFAQELDESLSQMLGPTYNVLGGLVQKEGPDSLGVQQKDGSDETLTNNGSSGKVAPLYQRVLSALIEEDESEELYIHSEWKNIPLQYASDDSHCGSCNLIDIEPKDRDRTESEAESMVNLPSQKNSFLDRISCGSDGIGNPSFSDPLHSIEHWPGDNISHSDAGLAGEICSTDPGELNSPSISSSDHQYPQMCLDDRLMLELQSAGLFPDSLPDLAEEDVINQDITKLKEGLYHQVGRKKRKLGKIDKAVQRGRDMERRNIEEVAINQLIERAYRKQLACHGNSNSRSTMRKISRQTALAFVKRTLARCRKFEETGSSCFREAALQEIIFSSPPCNNSSKTVECVGSGTGSNMHNEASNLYTDARGLGAVSSTCERDSHGNNFDRPRKREVFLDDVVGIASSKIRPPLDGSALGGVKSKRSYTNGNPTKDKRKNVSVSAASPSPLDGLRNERKTKLKPNQRTDASTLGNRTRGSSASVAKGSNKAGTEIGTVPLRKTSQDASKVNEPVEIANLQLHEFDPIGLEVSNELAETQDLDSWLNIDEDSLQDLDTIGLEIPMDDLSDLMLM